MSVKAEATIKNLYRVPENGNVEIRNHSLAPISSSEFSPEQAAGEIYTSLREYQRCTQSGYAIPNSISFIVDLPKRRSLCPDAAFYQGQPQGGMYLEGAPVFAAEVRSEQDCGQAVEDAMAAKRADYFAAGTLVVWDVDLLNKEVVRVYRASNPQQPQVYRRGEVAEAEPALPGWSMAVDNLFRGE